MRGLTNAAAICIGMLRRHAPSACSVGMLRRHAPSACSVGMHAHARYSTRVTRGNQDTESTQRSRGVLSVVKRLREDSQAGHWVHCQRVLMRVLKGTQGVLILTQRSSCNTLWGPAYGSSIGLPVDSCEKSERKEKRGREKGAKGKETRKQTKRKRRRRNGRALWSVTEEGLEDVRRVDDCDAPDGLDVVGRRHVACQGPQWPYLVPYVRCTLYANTYACTYVCTPGRMCVCTNSPSCGQQCVNCARY
jgi:hypothetical protein